MSQQQFRILTVCTMNICRSPALADLLSAEFANIALPTDVSSAGTAAVEGAPRCPESLVGTPLPPATGTSHELTATHIAEADLILTAARDHSGAVVQMKPNARNKTFPIRMAARLATWVVDDGTLTAAVNASTGQPVAEEFAMVPALPASPHERALWLVSEMAQARGLAPSRLSADDDGEVDLPDPHILSSSLHPSNAVLLTASAQALVRAFALVLDQ